MLSFIFKVYRLINLHQIHHLTLISRNLSYVKLWYFSYRKVMGQNALKTPFWYVLKIGWSNFWIIYIKRNPTSHEWNFLPNFRSTGIFLDFCTPLIIVFDIWTFFRITLLMIIKGTKIDFKKINLTKLNSDLFSVVIFSLGKCTNFFTQNMNLY